MKLNEIPDYIEDRRPQPITVRVEREVWEKLQLIRKHRRKKTADIVRALINEFLEDNKQELQEIA